MCDPPGHVALQKERLQEVLLAYLQAAKIAVCPGTDGLTLQDALLSYSQAAAAGLVPDKVELLRRHADLNDVLHEFFAGKAVTRDA